MIEIRDRARLETRLREEAAWAAYAIGDLEEPYFARTRWFLSDEDASSLVLRYGSDERVTLITFGDGVAVAGMLSTIPLPDRFDIHYPDTQHAALSDRLGGELVPYLRMVTSATDLRAPAEVPGIEWRLLAPGDLDAALGLYRHYPHNFFEKARLAEGAVLGGFEGSRLVTIAGTHVRSPQYRVAALGDIVTEVDWRGRGLGAEVTHRLTELCMADGIELVVLNVAETNLSARRCYEKIGFGSPSRHWEGSELRLLSS